MGKIKKISVREKEIENAILNWLSMHPNIFCWKVHTTGVYDPTKKVFRPLQGFATRFISDIMGIVKVEDWSNLLKPMTIGVSFAIEVKTPDTIKDFIRYIDPEYITAGKSAATMKLVEHARGQKEFLDQVARFGGVSGVASSVLEAQEIMKEVLSYGKK